MQSVISNVLLMFNKLANKDLNKNFSSLVWMVPIITVVLVWSAPLQGFMQNKKSDVTSGDAINNNVAGELDETADQEEPETSSTKNPWHERLRLRIDTEINDDVRIGIQLASGDPGTPVSINQAYTNLFLQKPFNLNRAFVTYNPKAVSMTVAAVTQSDAVARDVNRSAYDKIWQFAKWYDSDSNPVVQQVLFSGRYQHEYNALGADQGDNGEWNVRRMRFGPKVILFRNWLVHGEIEVNPQEADPFYLRVTDLYVKWTKSPAFQVTVGKHGVAFTMDGSTSSKELLTIDRSNLSNNLWFGYEYIPGVSVSGELGAWRYYGGIYSGGTKNREFGEFDAGVFTLVAVGYNFGEALGVKEALLMGNYVYQQEDPHNTFTRPLDHVGSVNFKFEAERWGVRGDLSYASGYHGNAVRQSYGQATGGRALHAHHERLAQWCAPRDLRETRGLASR